MDGKVQVICSGPLLASLIQECGEDDQSSHGLLFGSYGTKRSVSVTDSVENNIQLEYKIKVVRYAGFKHQRPNSSNVLQYTPNKLQCLGMFVIKRDGSMLYPSFKDMTSLNEIISTRAKGIHSPSSQPILLMFSAPKTNDVKNDQSWIYDMKHTCYLYRNHAPTRFVLTKLNIPSLAPDVQSQFDEARGLGSCVDDCDVVWSGNHGSQHPNSISCGITSMAAAGLAQVVDTELLMSDIIMSMQEELQTIKLLESEIEDLKRKKVEMKNKSK